LVKSKAELSGMNKGTKPKTSSTKSTQTALQKLKAMVNKNKKYKTYKGAGVDLEKDADRPALRTGRRIAKESGKTYYEYRANRIDVKQPPKKYPKLEKGGYMADGGEFGVKFIIIPFKTYNDMPKNPDNQASFIFKGTQDSANKKAQKFIIENNFYGAYVKKINEVGKGVSKNYYVVSKDKIQKAFEDGGMMAEGGETTEEINKPVKVHLFYSLPQRPRSAFAPHFREFIELTEN
jgi:hypothetical protein